MAVSRVSMSLSPENIQLHTAADRSKTVDTRTDNSIQHSLNQTNSSPHQFLIPDTVHNFIEKFVESDDQYEDLPTENHMVHVAAGCTAGIAEHCAMYPVDLIKTRMMAVTTPIEMRYTSMLNAFRSILATEGMRSLWRGMPVVFTCAGPAHGAYFASYEASKRYMGAKLGRNNMMGHMIAGGGASLVHDAVMTPVDAVKQRMQKLKSTYKSSWQCSKSMWKDEGVRSFYRSYGTQICMNVPQQCIHFMAYERIKRYLNPTNEYRPLIHIVSGGMAGGLAAVITTPLDVCKTLLNTQPTISETKQPAIRGLTNGLVTIYRVAGPTGYFKGWGPRVLTIAPSTAICWWIYEMFKFSLSDN